MATGKSRQAITFMICVSIRIIRRGDAFHVIKQCHPPITRTCLQVKDEDSSWNSERRAFLKSIATTSSSVIFLSLIATAPKLLAAADSDELSTPTDFDLAELDVLALSSEETATTPSISEGTLVISEPRSTRATVNVKAARNDEKKKSADPRFFIAGGASAAISHGVTTPIDVVKTRMQSDSALAVISPSEAAIKIIKDDGPRSLLVGLGPTVIGYGIEGALKFGVYESLKNPFLSLFSEGSSSEAYLGAAACAGALASIVLCPMEETRIRLVTDPTFGNGLLDGLPKLLKEDGVLSPFRRGMAPMLIKQVPYTIGKQVSFDLFASLLYSTLIGLSFVPQKKIALEVEIGAAFCASVMACLASHPGDVLLTATYKNGGDQNNVAAIVNEGGGGFFRGLNARFIHVGCIITLQLVLYDQIKQALGLPASGS